MAKDSKKMNIDREALHLALTNPKLRANSDWCVACGASAAIPPEMPEIVAKELEIEDSTIRQLVTPEFVSEMSEKLSTPLENSDWCVACGASKEVHPLIH